MSQTINNKLMSPSAILTSSVVLCVLLLAVSYSQNQLSLSDPKTFTSMIPVGVASIALALIMHYCNKRKALKLAITSPKFNRYLSYATLLTIVAAFIFFVIKASSI
ncbi:hypothetical protein [Acinetobacter sp. P1(2025)]|uniref:hypothetical protein n=1 Tax=Acinetobacter sp. P1(2025) TaxID=3446120 RepID=UPI003F53C256